MTEAVSGDVAISHFGICVSDLDRSVRFYCDAFGFTRAACTKLGPEGAKLVGVGDDLDLTCQFLSKDGQLIELLQFNRPDPIRSEVPRPHNKLGVTHFSFRVRDLDATARTIVALGGSILEETRYTFQPTPDIESPIVFCLDPDGLKIELMELPDSVRFE